MRQRATPLADALDAQRINRLAHFDVPAHKSGRGNPELTEYLGERAMAMDVNSMKPLDNLGHPVSVIRDAQRLAAEAFGADDAFFMVNGTTSAVQAMIMATCTAGDEIILPRNVHRSAINALVVCGAIPVYVNPGTDKRLGIPLGMRVEDVAKAIAEHPSAKAVLVNNPTYYGICSNLVEIVKLAHAAGMRVLADEAHGTHFYFHEELPVSAMAAGCDMTAASIHKTGGSLTQSSVLLTRRPVNPDYVRQVITLTQSTSASYLLLSSLDIARKNLFFRGRDMYQKTMDFADYAREEIKRLREKSPIGLFDHEYIDPVIALPPQEAFYAKKRRVPMKESTGLVAGEFVMSYPPGIPIVAPGERITPDVLEHILFAKEKGCFMTGTEDMNLEYINVLA